MHNKTIEERVLDVASILDRIEVTAEYKDVLVPLATISHVADILDELLDAYKDAIHEVDNKRDKIKYLEYEVSDLETELQNLEESSTSKCNRRNADEGMNIEMKEEWWGEARKKYTLVQLEEIFGNKFNLKDYKTIKTNRCS